MFYWISEAKSLRLRPKAPKPEQDVSVDTSPVGIWAPLRGPEIRGRGVRSRPDDQRSQVSASDCVRTRGAACCVRLTRRLKRGYGPTLRRGPGRAAPPPPARGPIADHIEEPRCSEVRCRLYLFMRRPGKPAGSSVGPGQVFGPP